VIISPLKQPFLNGDVFILTGTGMSMSMSMSTNMTMGGVVSVSGQKLAVPQMWVGNIPMDHATEEAVLEALRFALITQKVVGEGEDTGITHCTVRVKPEKKNGSWALVDFQDAPSMYRAVALKTKVSVLGADGESVFLDLRQSEM
jgi:hypothetical protein